MRERRQREERRRTPGRRSVDYQGRASLLTFVPALCGALVVVYLFFVAISGAELAEEPGWAIAALVLALIWLAPRGGACSPGGVSPVGRPRAPRLLSRVARTSTVGAVPTLSDRDKRLTLVAAIMGSFIALLDSTVVNVALPAIREDLGGGLQGQQWVVNAYLLFLGSLILIGGSLGDVYGRSGSSCSASAASAPCPRCARSPRRSRCSWRAARCRASSARC
jgi:hypothetical protein